jgi:thiamine pyrophosphate-dependent acetolactate synthase large subunit-like protein
MIVADNIARILKVEQVETIFGFPENRILDSVVLQGIRPIIARSERVAVNIADGYTRAHHGEKNGVVAVQDGPGAEAAFAAIAQAYSDNTPLLVLSGGYDRTEQSIRPNFSAAEAYRPITKTVMKINRVEDVDAQMRRAFTALRNGPSGPVLVEVARDVLYEEILDEPNSYRAAPRFPIGLDEEQVPQIVDAVVAAANPVILAGQGILYGRAYAELKRLAERLSIPVMTTLNGKSAFPENHELSLGTGARSRPDMVSEFLDSADLILALGTSLTRSDYITPLPRGKKVIHVTNRQTDIGQCYDPAIAVVGDVRRVLQKILAELGSRAGGDAAPKGKVLENLARSRGAFLSAWSDRLNCNTSPISPYRVVSELNRLVDKSKTVVTHDAGNPRDQLTPFYEAVAPGSYIGWGKTTQLGSGLGLAMGFALARPDWLAINVMGDAAFGHIGMDVETGIREKLPIMTIVYNNGVMGGYGRFMPNAVKAHSSNRVSGDYAKVAAALGAHSESVRDVSALAPALERCVASVLKDRRSSLLEVFTREEPVFPLN